MKRINMSLRDSKRRSNLPARWDCFVVALLLLATTLLASCAPAPSVAAITPPYIDTGIDPESWASIPAGSFPYGQHNHITEVNYDYEMMVTTVTNEQYARFLNEVLAAGVIRVGEVEVETGEQVWVEAGAQGFYPGDPYDGYKHEEEIKPGDKLFFPTETDGARITFDGQTFRAIHEYSNHPATMVTWFGANAYCEFYDWRLPSEIEWEKAARGTELVEGRGLPFPWGTHIERNNANYYSSFDLFVKMFGKLGNTTPVGFYNGDTYSLAEDSYTTLDSASLYGLYDMAGNVWQWTGDDYPKQHYRHMRGGSFYSYEVDLRVWKFNSAGPQHYSPQVGFRCAR